MGDRGGRNSHKEIKVLVDRLHCWEHLSFKEIRWWGKSQPLGHFFFFFFFSGGKIMSSVWSWFTQGPGAHLSSVSSVIWTSHLGARESSRGNVLTAWLNGLSPASKLCPMADTFLVRNSVWRVCVGVSLLWVSLNRCRPRFVVIKQAPTSHSCQVVALEAKTEVLLPTLWLALLPNDSVAFPLSPVI